MTEKNPIQITNEDIAYFMGRVDTQLAQILQMLKHQQSDLKVVSKLEQENQEIFHRVNELEGWKEEIGDHTNIVTFRWVREKLQVPIIVAVIIFLLTTLIPTIVTYRSFLGW